MIGTDNTVEYEVVQENKDLALVVLNVYRYESEPNVVKSTANEKITNLTILYSTATKVLLVLAIDINP